MEKLELKQIQEEEFELLKIFIKICDDYSLKYYITGGTLLGAIRHKGFIPWDDDIDLYMPREDYDRLIDLINNKEIQLDNNYCFCSKEINNYFFPFIKFVNKKIVANINTPKALDKYLWIDIFPLDGMPKKEKEAKRFINKMFIIGHLYVVKNCSWKEIKNSHTQKAVLIKLISKIITLFLSSNRLSTSLINNARKYKYDNSKYISNVIWVSEQRQFYLREIFDKTIKVEFEGIKVNTFSGYETLLKQNYGDYMKLPPENKRYTHSLDAYKLEENDNFN